MKNEILNSDNKKYVNIYPVDDVIYKKNLEAIKEFYPQYVDIIEATELNKNYHAVIAGKNKRYNVFSVKHNMFYYDPEDPNKDVVDQVESLELKNTRIAVFLGFGLGFMIDYYSRSIAQSQNTQFMIIIENDIELFKTAITYIDYSPMLCNPNIKLILGEKLDNLFIIYERIFRNSKILYLLKCIKPIFHNSVLRMNRDYYLKAFKTLSESVLYMLEFFGNDPYDSLIGIENMLDNIDEIIKNPGINLLFNKFKGKPAVIVSTGPSLNKNKHLLKGLEDKALILCPDASLRILLDIGVKPHLVTSLERIPETTTLMTGFKPEEVKDVYYAATPVIPNAAYEVYPGPRIIVYRNFDHFKWLEIDRGILDIKQSSGNMAYKIADALGCDPIILVGQDLAYSRDGRTHAAGSKFGEDQSDLDESAFSTKYEVMGNDGMPILTTSVWDGFRKAYEVDIAESKSTCINSTEGGALINGTLIMPLKDTIQKYINEKFDPLEKIKIEVAALTKANVEEDIKKIADLIGKTKKDLENMANLCMDGLNRIKDNEQLLIGILEGECDDRIKAREIINELLDYKTKVMKTVPTMQLFLMHIVQSYHIKFENDMYATWGNYDDELKAMADITFNHLKWYAIVYDIINICIESLNKSNDKLSALKKNYKENGA